ncbi:hypothetical protein AWW68_18855 [Roseivirga spongicola]|uniref:Uncharacterized protein n=1 Tax=Roseivirga spongicola TaxID=333140 RepID=A0A150XDX9_9BACT|nr:hypothetical protein [Roseivirga spongicola]KYG76918.1 hypothetical protein AWW68_18855 [Roseivirga spongicola]
MANQFTNTGFATILPRQTQGVYNTLLWGKRQAQENKEFQVKQRAAVDDFNYKVFKDYSNLDFKGMDGNHKAVLKDMASGYMSTALEAYKQARQQGVKLDPTALEKIKSDTYAARDIMLSHQQGMQELNQLYKQNPDLYSEDMLKDAFSQMYKTDEEGKIDVNSPNLDYSAQDLKKLASDPKYVNYGYGVNKFVEDMGKTISSKFSTFKDPNSGEFFDREEDFESYKRLVEMGENGRPKISEKTGLPIFKDSQAVLAEMAISPDPEIQASYKALLHNAEQQGISAVDLLDKELAPMRTSDLKKQDNTRIARTTGSKKKEEAPNTFNLVQGGSGEFESNGRRFTSDSMPMPGTLKNVPIEDKVSGKTETKKGTLEGLEYDPDTLEKSFVFTIPGLSQGEYKKVYIPLSDEKTMATVLNMLDDDSPEEREILNAIDTFKEKGELKSLGYKEDLPMEALKMVDQIRYAGNYEKQEKGSNEQTLEVIKSIGEEYGFDVSDIVPERSVWAKSIKIGDKSYSTENDAQEIANILLERIKQANPIQGEIPTTADNL